MNDLFINPFSNRFSPDALFINFSTNFASSDNYLQITRCQMTIYKLVIFILKDEKYSEL